MAQADIAFSELEDGNALGDVRALIPDTEQLPNPSNPDEEPSYLFSDSILGRYLRLHGATKDGAGDYAATLAQIKRATADACYALGRSEMLILKKITSQDRSTDGSVLANQYRLMGDRLVADADALEAGDDEPGAIVIRYRPRPAAFDGEYAARGSSRWG